MKKRVFKCGCVQESKKDVIYNYRNCPLCAKHKQAFDGYQITCRICGKVEVRRSARARYCAKHTKDRYKLYKGGKTPRTKKPKKPSTKLTAHEIEYILGHPWERSATIAEVLERNIATINKIKRQYGIPRTEPPLDRFFREHRLGAVL